MIRHRLPRAARVAPLASLASLVAVTLLSGVFSASPAAAADPTLKIATLAPQGSVWERGLEDMGATWARSGVGLRLYAGGVAGDEPDIVRKMRVGQLDGALFTVAGLSTLDPAYAAFEVPMFFDSHDEVRAVLESLREPLGTRLEDRGYRLLGWASGGWVHLFSRSAVRGPGDLRGRPIYSWTSAPSVQRVLRQEGLEPVALAAPDIVTALQTGMIDAMPTTPLAAVSLQWFRHTSHMQDLGFAPLVGAVVISERAWKRLDPTQRTAVSSAARTLEVHLFEEVPKQDAAAIDEMRSRGLEVVELTPEERAAWRALAERFAEASRKDATERGIFERVQAARDAFRR